MNNSGLLCYNGFSSVEHPTFIKLLYFIAKIHSTVMLHCGSIEWVAKMSYCSTYYQWVTARCCCFFTSLYVSLVWLEIPLGSAFPEAPLCRTRHWAMALALVVSSSFCKGEKNCNYLRMRKNTMASGLVWKLFREGSISPTHTWWLWFLTHDIIFRLPAE